MADELYLYKIDLADGTPDDGQLETASKLFKKGVDQMVVCIFLVNLRHFEV